VTVVKTRQRPLLMTYRTGEAAAAMLRYCAKPRQLADVLGLCGDERRGQSAELVNGALSSAVLLVVEPDLGTDPGKDAATDSDVAGADRSDSR